MSIATRRGDGGETGLAGGIRVSKIHPRVEAYGTLDELISTMGFARSICAVDEIRDLTKSIQKELFRVGSALATPPESRKTPPEITDEMVDRLTGEVHRLEAVERHVCESELGAVGREGVREKVRVALQRAGSRFEENAPGLDG